MASRSHDDRKRELSQLEEACLSDVPRKRISPSSRENMKETISTVEALSPKLRTAATLAVSGPYKACKVLYSKRRSHRPTLSPCYRKRSLPLIRGCDMANKENEVACAGNLPEKHLQDSRTYLLHSSQPGSSQADGPSSKYSSFFAEVSSEHEAMTQVLFSRNLRLNVALTFWRRQSVCELIAYLLRIQDLSVLVDCLPMLTNSIQEGKPHVSLGCCVDLLPLVTLLIRSRFEDYLLVGLNWLQALIKRWWSELSGNQCSHEDGNILILRHQLKSLWEHGRRICLLPGYTGNLAKDVEVYILQLH
ncbi:KATNB1-like protein 1 [Ambystoma mexicanum]|uniref:KATNB1-like protein 1 n=1 Tax=Ambystoma mexicanum TaxID=8296 RepID=UPI0037E8880E